MNCCKFELSRNFAGFRSLRSQQRLNEWIVSTTELYPVNCTFQRCIDYVDIAGRSSATGVKQGWMEKTNYFRAKCINTSKTVGGAPNVTIKIDIIGSCIRTFDWHQDRWPWMTLNCCKFELSRNFASFRRLGMQKRLKMKIDPYCLRQNCIASPLKSSDMLALYKWEY